MHTAHHAHAYVTHVPQAPLCLMTYSALYSNLGQRQGQTRGILALLCPRLQSCAGPPATSGQAVGAQ